jgi:hypothetical protein
MFNINKYWTFLCLLILGYGLFEYYRPKPLDWRESYSNKDNVPFGAEMLFELLPDLTGSQKVTSLRVPPYNHLADSLLPSKSSYIFINDEFDADENDQKALLGYVKKGNSVFISAYDFPDSLMRVLGVTAMLHEPSVKDTAKYVNYLNPLLRQKKGYIFPKDDGRNYFRINKFSNVMLLASNELNEPVFVQVNYGQGQFYLHNLPLAFTNYFVADTVANKHAFQAISYLPKQPVFWDEYQKQGRFGANENSVFRYIVSQPALYAAYLLAIIGLLLFAIFSGKRRQRIIPVIDPPKNVSLEFVKTIGNMYYRKGDHANMAEKLIHHFWFYVRERFGISASQHQNDELFALVAIKGGLSDEEMLNLQQDIFETDGKWTGDRLMELNKKLEDFYERTR